MSRDFVFSSRTHWLMLYNSICEHTACNVSLCGLKLIHSDTSSQPQCSAYLEVRSSSWHGRSRFNTIAKLERKQRTRTAGASCRPDARKGKWLWFQQHVSYLTVNFVEICQPSVIHQSYCGDWMGRRPQRMILSFPVTLLKTLIFHSVSLPLQKPAPSQVESTTPSRSPSFAWNQTIDRWPGLLYMSLGCADSVHECAKMQSMLHQSVIFEGRAGEDTNPILQKRAQC